MKPPMRDNNKYSAVVNIDWGQVLSNGGPPCFYLEAPDKFCLRAQRWAGHGADHKYISLQQVLRSLERDKSELLRRLKIMCREWREAFGGPDENRTPGDVLERSEELIAEIASRSVESDEGSGKG